MWHKWRNLALIVIAGLVTGSCGSSSSRGPAFIATNEPWHKDVEIACLNSGDIQQASYIKPIERPLSSNGSCHAVQPFLVSATLGGSVRLRPAATLQCGMIRPIDRWMRDVVQPAAQRHFGQGIVELKVLASFSCRPMNNVWGAKLSEHGHANAIDVGAFRFEDGSEVSVLKGWGNGGAEARFLREVHAGACRYFGTVLGPLADRNHRDHFHFDRMLRRRSNYCK